MQCDVNIYIYNYEHYKCIAYFNTYTNILYMYYVSLVKYRFMPENYKSLLHSHSPLR